MVTESSFVDERVELAALIFRLAGNSQLNDKITMYQRNLNNKFARYKDHDAVNYTKQKLKCIHLGEEHDFGYDAVVELALHLKKEKNSYILVNNIESLIDASVVERWTEENIHKFVEYLNQFNDDSNFAGFFSSKAKYFERQSKILNKNLTSNIDYNWFLKYLSENTQLRVIAMPFTSTRACCITVSELTTNEKIVTAALPVFPLSALAFHLLGKRMMEVVVHAFCHSFANAQADTLYNNDKSFRKLCDNSIDENKLFNYTKGNIMAQKYLTRAYTILYFVQHKTKEIDISKMINSEKNIGFKYIKQMYEIIAKEI
jgi:hypothetical protein